MRRLNLLLLLFATLLLGACAVPLSGQEMTPTSNVYDQLTQKLDRKITVGNVTASKGLGGAAPVVAEEYRTALISALRQAGWYTTSDDAKYTLNAEMIKIEQPFIGFDFTVKSTAQYDLLKSNGTAVYSEELTLPCTTRFAEAWDGTVRLRKATACSVSENITHLLKVLSSKKL